MITKAKALSVPETSFVLRKALGGVRAWDDVLKDMRRGKQHYHGLTLLPHGRYPDKRAKRPYYLASAVKDFIDEALKINPDSVKFRPHQMHEVEIDLADNRSWKYRILAKPLPVQSPLSTGV